MREHGVDLGQLFFGQMEIQRTGIFLEILPPLRSRNRDEIIPPSQNPRKRELTRSTTDAIRDFSHFVYQRKIFLEVVALKARAVAPVVIIGKIFRRFERSSKKSSAEWTVWNEADSKAATSVEDIVLGIASP